MASEKEDQNESPGEAAQRDEEVGRAAIRESPRAEHHVVARKLHQEGVAEA